MEPTDPSDSHLTSPNPFHQQHQLNGAQPLLGHSLPDPRAEDFPQLVLIDASILEGKSLRHSMSALAFRQDPETMSGKHACSHPDSPRCSKSPLPTENCSFPPIHGKDLFSQGILASPEDAKIISLEEQQDMVGQSLSASLSNIALDLDCVAVAETKSGNTSSTNISPAKAPKPAPSSWQQLLVDNAALSSKHITSNQTPSGQLESNIKSHSAEKLVSRNPLASETNISLSPSLQFSGSRSADLLEPSRETCCSCEKLTKSCSTSPKPLGSQSNEWKVVGSPPRRPSDSFSSSNDPLGILNASSGSSPKLFGHPLLGGRARAASVLEPSLFSSNNISLWSTEAASPADNSKLTVLNSLNQFPSWIPETSTFFSPKDPNAVSLLSGTGGEGEFNVDTFVSSSNTHDFGPIGGEQRNVSEMPGFNASLGNKGSFRNRSKSQSFTFQSQSFTGLASEPSMKTSDYSKNVLFNSSIPVFDIPSTRSFLNSSQQSDSCDMNAAAGNSCFKNQSPDQSDSFPYNLSFIPTNMNPYQQGNPLPNVGTTRMNSSNPIKISNLDNSDFGVNSSLNNLDMFPSGSSFGSANSFVYSYPNSNPTHPSGYSQQSVADSAGYDESEDSSMSERSAMSNPFPSARPRHSSPFQLSSYKGPLYLVEFKSGRTEILFIQEANGQPEFGISIGDYVIVEADRGEDLGKVVGSISIERMKQIMNDPNSVSLTQSEIYSGIGVKEIIPKRIHRLARPADVRLLQTKAQEEAIAMLRCQSKVRQKKLPMEVVDAEYQWDRNKLTFYFVSDRRIDFRELVRDLFRIYKTRIWMCAVDKYRLKLLVAQNALPEGHGLIMSPDDEHQIQLYEHFQEDLSSIN